MQELYDEAKLEILPKLYWMVNGVKFSAGGLNLLGLGKIYGENTWNNAPLPKNGKARRRRIRSQFGHYTKGQVERSCNQGPIDILITHQAGENVNIGGITSNAKGIHEICAATKPKLMIHGSYNKSLIYNNPVTGTLTISLAFNEIKAIDFNKGQKQITIF